MGRITGDFPIPVLPLRTTLTLQSSATDFGDKNGHVYKRNSNGTDKILECSQKDNGCSAYLLQRLEGNVESYRIGHMQHVMNCIIMTCEPYEYRNMWLTLSEPTFNSLFTVSWISYESSGQTDLGASIIDRMGHQFRRCKPSKALAFAHKCEFPDCPVEIRVLEDPKRRLVLKAQIRIGRNDQSLVFVAIDHKHGDVISCVDINVGSSTAGFPKSTQPNSTLSQKFTFAKKDLISSLDTNQVDIRSKGTHSNVRAISDDPLSEKALMELTGFSYMDIDSDPFAMSSSFDETKKGCLGSYDTTFVEEQRSLANAMALVSSCNSSARHQQTSISQPRYEMPGHLQFQKEIIMIPDGTKSYFCDKKEFEDIHVPEVSGATGFVKFSVSEVNNHTSIKDTFKKGPPKGWDQTPQGPSNIHSLKLTPSHLSLPSTSRSYAMLSVNQSTPPVPSIYKVQTTVTPNNASLRENRVLDTEMRGIFSEVLNEFDEEVAMVFEEGCILPKKRRADPETEINIPNEKTSRLENNNPHESPSVRGWLESPGTYASEDYQTIGTLNHSWRKFIEEFMEKFLLESPDEFNETIPVFIDSIIKLQRKEGQFTQVDLGIPQKMSTVSRFEYTGGWNERIGSVVFKHCENLYYKCKSRSTRGCLTLTTNDLGYCSIHRRDLTHVVVLVEDFEQEKGETDCQTKKVILITSVLDLENPAATVLGDAELIFLMDTNVSWRKYLKKQHKKDRIPIPSVLIQGLFPLSETELNTGTLSSKGVQLLQCIKSGMLSKGWFTPKPVKFIQTQLFGLERSSHALHYLGTLGIKCTFVSLDTFDIPGFPAGSTEALNRWMEMKQDFGVDVHVEPYVTRNDVQRMCKGNNCSVGSNFGQVFLLKKSIGTSVHVYIGRNLGIPKHQQGEHDTICHDHNGYSTFLSLGGTQEFFILGAFSQEETVIQLESLAIFLVYLYSCKFQSLVLHNTKIDSLAMSDKILRRARLLLFEALDIVVKIPLALTLRDPSSWKVKKLKKYFGSNFVSKGFQDSNE